MRDGSILIANSVGYGIKYFAKHAALFLPAVDGVVAEGFRGPGKWPPWRYFPEAIWKRNLDMMSDIHKHNKYFIAVAKYQADSDRSVIQQNLRLAMESFLLAADPRLDAFASRIQASGDKLNRLREPWLPTDLAGLGTALGEYEVSQGIYKRAFQHGLLLVNPSSQPRTWQDATLKKTIMLEPHTVDVVNIDSHLSQERSTDPRHVH